jgi:S1-C subfamily serine protease
MGLAPGAEETLVVAGSGDLPAGTYHVKAVLVSGEATHASLAVEPARASAVVRPEPLPVGRWVPAGLEAPPTVRWWTVEAPAGAATVRAQVTGASSDVDLVAVDLDTGAIVARSLSERVDESLVVPLDGREAAPRRFGLGAFARDAADEPVSLRIAVGAGPGPDPPKDVRFPPFRPPAASGVERAVDAVVEIVAKDGLGSGVCVSPLGHVLTARHVLEREDGPGLQTQGILVGFTDDPSRPARQQFVAEVVESDEALDLALLRITEDVYGRRAPVAALPHLPPAGDPTARLGDAVLSIGFPGCGSERCRTPVIVSQGVLSGLERTRDLVSLVKTDAMVADGHSGGALVSRDGAFVGVLTASLGDRRPLGLAVPVGRLPEGWRRAIGTAGGK